MSSVDGLQLAIDLATRQRDEAGKVMAQCQRAHHGAQAQRLDLDRYANDTAQRWSVSAHSVVVPDLMRSHYQFMGRLQSAIELQDQVAADLLVQLEAARRALLEAELRVASLKRVLMRKRALALKLQDQRDQKQLDEFAAMRHRSNAQSRDIKETQ